MQVDFGEALAVIAGEERKIHFFAMDLPHSDACLVQAYPAETTEASCDGHNVGFEFFGGVPRSNFYDNTKLAVARILGDGRRQRTRTFNELQSHYLFADRFGRPGKGNGQGQGPQFAIKNLAKAEFLLGVALNMCDAVNSRAENVQNLLAEMINTVELLRAAIRASEADHVPGPASTVLPNAQPLWSVRLLFPQLYPRLVEIVQILGSSNLVMMPSLAEFAGERAEDVALYCQGVGMSAEQRVRLFRLAWDVSCSSFAGRQTLYERFFSGDPWRLGMARYQNYPLKDSLKQRVWDFIARAGHAPDTDPEGRA